MQHVYHLMAIVTNKGKSCYHYYHYDYYHHYYSYAVYQMMKNCTSYFLRRAQSSPFSDDPVYVNASGKRKHVCYKKGEPKINSLKHFARFLF